MRQYGEVPPWLSTAAAPQVKTVAGIGTGGGAGVQTKDGQGFGEVILRSGSNPSAGGNVVLQFPQTPPTLFISGDEEFGVLTVTGQTTTTVTISWATTLPPSRRLRLHYEWNASF